MTLGLPGSFEGEGVGVSVELEELGGITVKLGGPSVATVRNTVVVTVAGGGEEGAGVGLEAKGETLLGTGDEGTLLVERQEEVVEEGRG